MIPCNNALHLVEIKSTKNIFGAQMWVKEAKIGPETRFCCQFLKFGSLAFLEIAYNDNLQQCITSNRSKFCEKSLVH